MKHLKDISVLVLGLGDSGLAMARWCAGHGARVQVWDSRENPPHAAALAEELPSAQRLSGMLSADSLQGVQLVLKSPGLAPTDERIVPLLNAAAQTGVPVQGELGLFARALADLKAERGYAPKVVAITGTNGKTTTTSMAAQLIERTGRRVAMAGNIGPTMLKTLADALALEPVVEAVVAVEVIEPAAENTPTSVCPELVEGVVQAEEGLRQAQPERDGSDVALERDGSDAALEMEGASAQISVRPEPVEGPVHDEEGIPSASSGQSEIQAQPERDGGDATPQTEPEMSEAKPAPTPVDAAIESATDAAPAPIEPVSEDTTEVTGGGPPPHLIPPAPPGPVFEHLPDVWVLELSSFQLDGVQGFEPSAATVLNVTQDHLDWHGSMEAYAAAKARIFGAQAVMVINRDDPATEKMIPAPTPGKGRFAKPVQRQVVRFGLDAPQRPGDYGLLMQNGIAWLVRALESDETIKRGTKRGAVAEEEELHIQRLMPADALRVRGRHNASNALAALALATAIDCPLAPMLHGLREYGGEPHRVQFITTVNGVEAYDDSKGTNVGATVAALKGLGEDKAPAQLVVILGGDGKGQDFSPLYTPVQRHVRAIATLGRDASAIEQALQGTGLPMQRHDSLQAATRWAFEQARSGDAVLLSPACASLDMFSNYAHRAEVFVAEVLSIAADAGSIET